MHKQNNNETRKQMTNFRKNFFIQITAVEQSIARCEQMETQASLFNVLNF